MGGVRTLGQYGKGALAGAYAGISAEATVAGGVGGKVTIGGRESFTLQPIRVETQKGLNIAGGIGSIRLEYKP